MFVVLLVMCVAGACNSEQLNMQTNSSAEGKTADNTTISSSSNDPRENRGNQRKEEGAGDWTVPKKLTALDPKKKHVALSFDDGPHHLVTPRVLDILAKYNAHATFFVLGNRAGDYPELIRRMIQEGHEVGNHSWSHPRFSDLSQQEIKTQIGKTDQEIAKTVNYDVSLVRPPYGEINDRVQSAVDGPIVNWSVDTCDWKSRNPQSILEEVQRQVEDGAIILMHDIYPSTADGLDKVLNWLGEQGYQVVTVGDLLEFSTEANSSKAGEVFFSSKKAAS